MHAYAAGYEDWVHLAVLFHPDASWYAKEIHQGIGASLARFAKNGSIPVDIARVYNLVANLVWIADETHGPDDWPTPRRALGEID